MIERSLRLMLCFQLLAALGIAARLAGGKGWSWPVAVAAGLAAPVLVHGGIVLANFMLALHAHGRAAGGPGGAALTRAWLREWRDSLLLYDWLMPWRAREDWASPARPDRVPVVLVHGFLCNRGAWGPLARRLAARGHACEAPSLEPPFASIDDYAPQVAAAIARLKARTGARRVALVGHSMGGLAIRAFLRACGAGDVAAVVTIGSPHGGTVHARLGLGRNARQMEPGSPWLRELAAAETPALRARFTVIRSLHDNIVAPQAAQVLEGARNLAFPALGHVTLAFDPAVVEAVEAALDAAREPEGSTGAAPGGQGIRAGTAAPSAPPGARA